MLLSKKGGLYRKMKKFVKALGLMVMALCLGVALVACSSDVDGTYECKMGEGELTATITLELKDGDFTMTLPGTSGKQTGTYKVDGEKITLTAEGQSITGTVKDGKITISMDNQSLTFTKK